MAEEVDKVQQSFDEWIELSLDTSESQRATNTQSHILTLPLYKKLNALKMMPSPFTCGGHSDGDSLDLQIGH